MNILEYLKTKPGSFIWVIGLLLNFVIGIVDYLTGYEIGIEIFYLIPIGLLSWFINISAGIIMSIISAGTIIYASMLAGKVYQNYFVDFWDIFVHLGFFLVFVYLINEEKIISDKNRMLISDLQKALDEIKTLSKLLPMCSSCKKIRDDDGFWKQIDLYIREHTNTEFSHGICPECKEKLYPGFAKKM